MANIQACLSSKTDNWSTPQDFFDKLNDEFHFNLDPCANEENHKCDLFYTKEQDGLTKDWGGTRCFLQSSVWKRDCGLGSLLLRAVTKTQHYCCYADPG